MPTTSYRHVPHFVTVGARVADLYTRPGASRPQVTFIDVVRINPTTVITAPVGGGVHTRWNLPDSPDRDVTLLIGGTWGTMHRIRPLNDPEVVAVRRYTAAARATQDAAKALNAWARDPENPALAAQVRDIAARFVETREPTGTPS